ncbi:putative multi-domain protein [Sinomonas atrocyanea]|uniref:Putative multi-domain protein n=2 Tax=Sinomonas atrocyanea TaxID=37927 RepID=A0A126ZV46_9MICC|nr:putative multi-domain protein [Sinomonas atrocyanea]
MFRLGSGGKHAEEMMAAGYVGVSYGIDFDLGPHLGKGADAFHRAMNDAWLAQNPGKSRVSAGLAMGNTWVACEGMQEGDVVLTRKADQSFITGTVTGGYEFAPGTELPHRRPVAWHAHTFTQDEMSPELAAAARVPMTVYSLSGYAAELAALNGAAIPAAPLAYAVTAEVEEQLAFQMEKQLEDFLVQNWAGTSLGREYDIYEDGEVKGQQFPADGRERIDILAISKDRKRLLVVELKRDRASDVVVGQIQRYMGYVQDELLEEGQSVEGVIIARDDDQRIRRALSVAPNIRFMKYRVDFHLE